MNRNLELVLFDLDGTLVDSADLILTSFRHTMEVHFGESPPDEVWLRTLGTPLAAQFAEFVDTPEGVQEMIATYVEHNLREHERLIRPFEGALDVVNALRKRGVPLGIVTSKAERGTRASLAACGLSYEAFDVVVTSDEPVPHKPDPAPVHLALERLGRGPEGALFVGDSIWDLRAGRAAGTRTGAALWGPFEAALLAAEDPDHQFQAIDDVLSLFDHGTA